LVELAESRSGKISLNKPYLGLPIVYQSVGRARFSGTLEPHASGRMASPIILRPIKFSDNSIRPAVLALRGPRPFRIRLRDTKDEFDLATNPADEVLRRFDGVEPVDAAVEAARLHFGRDSLVLEIGIGGRVWRT
jgi:hypothetical protein